MALGDFHTHTHHSDGLLSPVELVERAATNGVEVLAVTDHDTTAGLAEAEAAARSVNIRLIAGVELSADSDAGDDYHILGYFPSVPAVLANGKFQEQLHAYRVGRQQRGRVILERLAALRMPLDWERILAIAGPAAVGRPHIAQAMVERGYVASVREAFDRYLYDDGPITAEREKLPPSGAIELIRSAGGVAVLAHPCFLPDPAAAVTALKSAGLTGLEVYYKNLSQDEISAFAALAESTDLIASGGSDYHGIHDDERDPGDIPFADTKVQQFVDGLETQWQATVKLEREAQ